VGIVDLWRGRRRRKGRGGRSDWDDGGRLRDGGLIGEGERGHGGVFGEFAFGASRYPGKICDGMAKECDSERYACADFEGDNVPQR
jgi:hypothetical protein